MGPKLFSVVSKRTSIAYSIRLLPVGGFVSMAGEDEESDDENAFCNKPVWQRIIIAAAGASVNIISGVIVMTVLVSVSAGLASNVIAEFVPEESFGEEFVYNSSEECGLMIGDKIVRVESTFIHTGDELSYEILHKGFEPIDITVLRNGEKLVFENVSFPVQKEQGVSFGTVDFKVYAEEKTFFSVVKHGLFKSLSTVKMIWESLVDLVTGRYGFEAVSGPVAVTQTLAEAANVGIRQFVYLAVVISMNLGVMNLLPLPALDGGRIVFLIVELIIRRPVNKNVEGLIHFVGIVLLMTLMLVITLKDIIGLF